MTIHLVQLTPRRGFDLARCLYRVDPDFALFTDMAIGQTPPLIVQAICKRLRINLNSYLLSNYHGKFRIYPLARVSLSIAIATRNVPLLALVFYLTSQLILQVSYIASVEIRRILYGKRSLPAHVIAFDTGAFLLGIYMKAFWPGSLLHVEQCVSPRFYQMKYAPRFLHKCLSCQQQMYYKALYRLELIEWANCKSVVCPSEIVASQVKSISNSSCNVINIPYPLSWPIHKPHYWDDLLKQPLTNEKPVNLLFVGNDFRRKGLTDLINALDHRSIANQIVLHIAGNIDFNLVQDYLLKASIKFIFHGKVDAVKLTSIYQQSSILVSPSYIEGSAMTILEAASFGLCIMASRQSGCNFNPLSDFIEFECGDIPCLRSKLASLLQDRALISKYGMAAFKAAHHFNHARYSQEWQKVLSSE